MLSDRLRHPSYPSCFVAAAFFVCIAGSCQFANATIITNGTFDVNLSGWNVSNVDSVDTTWNASTAHVGAPGTPGTSILSQSFDIPVGTASLDISFKYLWQVSPPVIPDTFSVLLSYASTSGPPFTEVTLLTETSATGSFGATTMFSISKTLIDLASGSANGKIEFKLVELNATRGTRIELDNVVVNAVPGASALAVPEASDLAVWSLLSLAGVVVLRRRKANKAA